MDHENLQPDPIPPRPPKWDLSDEALERDCDLEFFIAGGPGGQHRNKTETAVRVTHRPSGLVVTATNRRSQAQNRAEAFAKLKARLAESMKVQKKRRPTRPTRASKQRRLEGKRRQAEKKQTRRQPPD